KDMGAAVHAWKPASPRLRIMPMALSSAITVVSAGRCAARALMLALPGPQPSPHATLGPNASPRALAPLGHAAQGRARLPLCLAPRAEGLSARRSASAWPAAWV